MAEGYERKSYNAWTLKDDFWSKKRIANNSTYEIISAKLGINKQTVSRYFSGASMPTGETVKTLCEWWGIDSKKGISEFKKLHKAYGEAHPDYIEYYGAYRKPEYVERAKERKKTYYARKKNKGNTPSGKTKVVSSEASTKLRKVWTKVDNFWSRERVKHDYTLEELADVLHRNTLTVRGYFTGFNFPSDDKIQQLCSMWDIDFEKGKAEFEKIHLSWGKAHPNYIHYGHTYVTKGSIEAKRARDKVRVKSKQNNSDVTWRASSNHNDIMRILFDKLSYDDFMKALSFTKKTTLMKYLYKKLSYTDYKEIEKI